MSYTEQEIKAMRDAIDGIYVCECDCYKITMCKKKKIFAKSEQEQLSGICRKCDEYCEEDK